MEQMTLYWVLGGLLILALALASIAQRYHAFIEERRRRIERILQRAGELEATIGRLRGLPAPPELEPLLRRDILARLEVIRQVHPRQPGIGERIERVLAGQAAEPPPSASRELDETELDRLLQGLGQVRWMLQEQRFVTPVGEEERDRLLRAIDMTRAETLYRFHHRQLQRHEQAGSLHQACWHGEQVLRYLREEAPVNEQTDAWYREIEARHRALSARARGQSPDSSLEEPPSE